MLTAMKASARLPRQTSEKQKSRKIIQTVRKVWTELKSGRSIWKNKSGMTEARLLYCCSSFYNHHHSGGPVKRAVRVVKQ
jgi:hypothetical protein